MPAGDDIDCRWSAFPAFATGKGIPVTASGDGLSQQRVQILRRTTPLLDERREEFEDIFFAKLFAGHPEIEAVFDGMDRAAHRAKLWTAISTMVASDGGRDRGYAP